MSTNAIDQVGRLRVRRRAAGLSQQTLAERAGCSLSMVRLLESGFTPRHSAVLRSVLSVLNGEGPAANGPDAKEGDTTAHAAG